MIGTLISILFGVFVALVLILLFELYEIRKS